MNFNPKVIIKIAKGTKDIRCKCGGQVMVDGEARHRVPLGFGFAPGESKFRVDFVEYRGWYGECMRCRKQVFAYHTKSHKVKYPAKINKAIGGI